MSYKEETLAGRDSTLQGWTDKRSIKWSTKRRQVGRTIQVRTTNQPFRPTPSRKFAENNVKNDETSICNAKWALILHQLQQKHAREVQLITADYSWLQQKIFFVPFDLKRIEINFKMDFIFSKFPLQLVTAVTASQLQLQLVTAVTADYSKNHILLFLSEMQRNQL